MLELALNVLVKVYVPTAPPKNTLPSANPADADDMATSEPPPLPPVCTTVPVITSVSPETSPKTCCLTLPDTPEFPARVILSSLIVKVPEPLAVESQ